MQSKIRLGYQWALRSLRLLMVKPARAFFLAVAYVFLFMLLPMVPGLPAFIKLAIFVSWSIFVAVAIGVFRSIDANNNLGIQDVFLQIRPKISSLLWLSTISIVYGLTVSAISQGDGDRIVELANSGGSNAAMLLREFLPLIAKILLLSSPLLMATWFAPALIGFAGYSLPHSIKSSIAGCLVHAVTLCVAWLSITFFMMLALMTISLLVALLGLGGGGVFVQLIAVVSLLFATAWTLAFQYVSYQDTFEPVPVGGGEIAM